MTRTALSGVVLLLSASIVALGFVVAVAGPDCTITGSAGADAITGTAGRDVICARGGNDWIDPGGGDDLVFAGSGRDFVRRSAGADVVKGGPGRDHLVGGRGPDDLYGGDGADTCLNLRDGTTGNDFASGGAAIDAGTRNGGDTFVGIEIEVSAPPYCPPPPPEPPA